MDSDSPERRDDPVRIVLADAAARFRAGEIRASAELALAVAERSASLRDAATVTEAALIAAGVPDPAIAATVERMCRLALQVQDTTDPGVAARLHAQLSVALHHRERLDEAAREVDVARSLAALAGTPRSTAEALHARLLAMAGSASGPELRAVSDEMLAAALADGSSSAELMARSWRTDALIRSGELASAGHEIDSLDVLAARTAEPLVRWNALVARAGLDHALGRLDDAERQARLARDAMPTSQRGQTEPVFIAQLMLVSTDRGVPPPELGIAEGLSLAAPIIAMTMTGRFHLELGDRTAALAAFEAIRPRLPALSIDRRGLPTLAAATELAAAFGDVATAGELRDRLLPFDDSMIAGSIGAVGPVAFYLSQAESKTGLHDEAVRHAQAAIDLAARGGFGPWLARSRLALAKALIRRGRPADREAARRAARLASVAARQIGMRRLAERAARSIDELASQQPLSRRESEVARLVARGSSNRDIALALGISERTVETHVQNILGKLGIRSRTQIAIWAAAEGAASDG
ncbi:MAG TPA: LuxR C-terminal-related transcriptional regulator [Candidatus Limnocylindrales bacterium]|nr:LuxR C-terminal-related transcriptional regulator [Candidatus Limnocylindrales bacterium]